MGALSGLVPSIAHRFRERPHNTTVLSFPDLNPLWANLYEYYAWYLRGIYVHFLIVTDASCLLQRRNHSPLLHSRVAFHSPPSPLTIIPHVNTYMRLSTRGRCTEIEFHGP